MMGIYYINYKPHCTYSTLILGFGGFIPKEYSDNIDYLNYVGRRQFHISKGYLKRVIAYIVSRDEDCTIKIRDERSDEWENYDPNDRRWV